MIKHERWHIAVAFGVGAVLIVAPVVLVAVLYALDKMEPRWYMYLIFIPVGIFSVVRGFMFLADNRNIKMLQTQGVKVKGKYLSHGTNHGDRNPVYYVRYSFEDENGQTVLATSPAQYTWEQALAFRAAQEFTVLYKNGKYMIGEDAARLFEKHFDDVTKLKQAYNEAFNIVYRDMIEEAQAQMNRRTGAAQEGEAQGEQAQADEAQGEQAQEDEDLGKKRNKRQRSRRKSLCRAKASRAKKLASKRAPHKRAKAGKIPLRRKVKNNKSKIWTKRRRFI